MAAPLARMSAALPSSASKEPGWGVVLGLADRGLRFVQDAGRRVSLRAVVRHVGEALLRQDPLRLDHLAVSGAVRYQGAKRKYSALN